MSEEKKTDKVTEEPKEKDTKTEDSEKTYSQKDFDRAVSKMRDNMMEKFKDYETNKSNLEDLENKLKEYQLKEKTEIERKEIELKEMQEKLINVTTEYDKQKKINLRNEVLSLGKYANLPDLLLYLVSK